MERSVERTQRTFITLVLGIPLALVVLGFAIWGGWRGYERWEERHLVRRAAAFLSGGDFKAGTLSARRALQMNPDSIPAMRIMAQVAEQARDRAAIDWRRKILELAPNSDADALALAESALLVGDVKIAETALADIPANARNTAEYHASRARLLKARNKPQEAKEEWKRAAGLASNNDAYRLQLSLALLEDANPAERQAGITALQELRGSKAQRAPATRALLLDGVAHHADARAMRELAKELQAYPEAVFSDRMLYLEILRQLHDDDYPAYLAAVQKSASDKPADLAALLTWMNANGLSADGVVFANSLPPAVLGKWPVPWARAEALAKLGRWVELEKFTDTSDWGAYDFLRHAYLSRAFHAEDKQVAAEREWTSAVKTASALPASLQLLVRLTGEWGWRDKTVELLWALSKHPEKQSEAFMTLYQHYAKTGDTQGLYRVLLRMAELDPADLKVQNNLAQISLLLNADVEHARQMAAELYQKDPTNPAVVSTYAYSLRTKGDAQGALKVISALGPNDLHDPALAAYYGILLSAAGEKEKARPYLEIGKNAPLLPEEKLLVERASSALNP